MEIDPYQRKKAHLDAKRKDLQEEQNHLERLRRVFEGDDGLAVLEWILSDLCGFWTPSLDANTIGKFNVGRSLFNAVSVADIGIAHSLLDRRRALADRIRNEEQRKIEAEAKEIV